MRLLRLSDVPANESDRVFRASPVIALAWSLIVTAGATAVIAFGWREQAWPFYYVGGVFLFGVWLLRRYTLARFRATNWLVRVNDTGVYVQFRSYLNHHLPAEDPTVVVLPLGEIRSVRKVRERRETPDRGGGRRSGRVTVEYRTLVEIGISGDSEELHRALAAERERHGPREKRWYGSTSVVYRHYPVRCPAPDRIEIEWRVSPSAERFFACLAPHVRVAEPVKASKDFTGLASATREEQESKLLELAESGQTIAAIALARDIYGFGLTEAKAFVEGLLGKANKAA